MIERNISHTIEKYLFNEDILLIIGARQVGKTTILKELEKVVSGHGHPVDRFTLEDPELLSELNKHPDNLFKFTRRIKQKKYILLDEIQYLENPSNFLKYHYDENKTDLKLIVSGSSAFYIDDKFTDSLAGRKRILEMYPFSFSEFLRAKEEYGLSDIIRQPARIGEKRSFLKQERRSLWQYWLEYSLYGGYPKIVLENDPAEKIALLKELATSFLKKDVLESGIKEAEKFFKLIKILAAGAGQLVNTNELSRILEISKDTVFKYIYLLRKSYIVQPCTPFYRNMRKELVKMPKIFFYDNGYRNYLLNNFSDFSKRPDKGAYLENMLFGELTKNHVENIKFWRTQDKNEIDFVVQDSIAFEMKSSKKSFKKNKYRNFCETYPDIPLEPVVPLDEEYLDMLDFTG